MSNTPNKVRFNLKNVHYSKLTFGSGGSVSFGPVLPVPGAVSLNLDANGEPEIFWGDGIAYYTMANNQGYAGDLEVALIPEDFRTQILHESADANGVLVERSDTEVEHFALLFEFDGDKRHIRHVLYDCIASRPKMEGKTNTEKKEVQTETLHLSAVPLSSGVVKSRTAADTDSAVYDGWYSTVYQTSAAETAARLSALSITGVALSPAFSAGVYNYTASTTAATNVVSASGASGTTVTLLVNGSAHTSGQSATWNTGTNTVAAIVSKSGLTSKTYTITVTKSAS